MQSVDIPDANLSELKRQMLREDRDMAHFHEQRLGVRLTSTEHYELTVLREETVQLPKKFIGARERPAEREFHAGFQK